MSAKRCDICYGYGDESFMDHHHLCPLQEHKPSELRDYEVEMANLFELRRLNKLLAHLSNDLADLRDAL
jgi:hypothetical protein